MSTDTLNYDDLRLICDHCHAVKPPDGLDKGDMVRCECGCWAMVVKGQTYTEFLLEKFNEYGRFEQPKEPFNGWHGLVWRSDTNSDKTLMDTLDEYGVIVKVSGNSRYKEIRLLLEKNGIQKDLLVAKDGEKAFLDGT